MWFVVVVALVAPLAVVVVAAVAVVQFGFAAVPFPPRIARVSAPMSFVVVVVRHRVARVSVPGLHR